jgi:ubiquinone/menaquinone biosynthesis C-methylase UbiE
MAEQTPPPVLDYEGSTYRTDFWEGQGREYEDRVERIAIRRLLPQTGGRLLELGAGFGRLTPLYESYDQVVLLDYSRSQLEYAREHYGDEGFIYVAANIYEMPFASGIFDTATLVRVLHHLADPPAVFKSIRDLLHREGTFLLEFANKQNLKAILRWLLRRQEWNPFTPEPVEFVELHYDFHPRYIREELSKAGLTPGRMLTVSHFRIGWLKRLIPAGLLAALDSIAQLTGNWWQLSPSVFILNTASGDDKIAPEGAFWRCPACGSYDLTESPDGLDCAGCNTHWPKINGVYSFKEEG